jgi:hypothetical protein
MMIPVKTMRIAVLLAIVAAATAPVCAAQELRVGADSAPIMEAVARYAASWAGRLDQAQTPAGAVAVPPAKSWRQRHPVAFGALIGAGIGAGLGAVGGALKQDRNMVTAEGLALVSGGIGAGIGALVGLAFGERP